MDCFCNTSKKSLNEYSHIDVGDFTYGVIRTPKELDDLTLDFIQKIMVWNHEEM